MPNNIRYIVLYGIFACSCMYIIEQYSEASYLIKTLLKILVFESGVIIYKLRTKKSQTASQKTKSSLRISIYASIAVFFMILGVYGLLGHTIDESQIIQSLEESGVTLVTLGWIFVYITFGNSFLEESFFRGMIFLGLRKWNRVFAYIFSAGLFSLYHIGIFISWFNTSIVFLCLFGLFAGGLLFAWIADRSESFIGSWIFHIGADIAIVLIGLRMFGVI